LTSADTRNDAMSPRSIVTTSVAAALALLVLLVGGPSTYAGPENPREAERIPYRQLTWADFRVNDAAPGKSAQTLTFLSYQYTARAEGIPGAFTAKVAETIFNGGFDRSKSWRRSSVSLDNRLLLIHEQGHFDITELKRRQLQQLPLDELPEGAGPTPKAALDDLDQKMRAFYRWHVADMEQIQRRYDRETEHGIQRDLQAQWNTRLRVALQIAAQPVTPPSSVATSNPSSPAPLPVPANP
jgi:hypothetical protein